MDESQSPVVTETLTEPSMSLGGRLGNIFLEPGEVYEQVKASPPKPLNWIIPLIITMVVGIISALVIYSQPAILQKLKETQTAKIQEMVKSGKIPQATADQIEAQSEKFMGPVFLKIVGAVSAVVGSAVGLFFIALILWFLGKFVFRAEFDFMRGVEVTGLSMMISALGVVLLTCLACIFGNLLATPSPALLLGQIDPTNRLHVTLSSLNVITIWHIAVLSIGLSKLTGVRVLKSALWLYGAWAVVTFGVIWAVGGK